VKRFCAFALLSMGILGCEPQPAAPKGTPPAAPPPAMTGPAGAPPAGPLDPKKVGEGAPADTEKTDDTDAPKDDAKDAPTEDTTPKEDGGEKKDE
jgi:hypothetical protein